MTKFRVVWSTTDGTPKQSIPDFNKFVPYCWEACTGGILSQPVGNSPNFGINTKSLEISNSITEYIIYLTDESNSLSTVNRSSKADEIEELPYKAGFPGKFHRPPYSLAPSPLASQYLVTAIL